MKKGETTASCNESLLLRYPCNDFTDLIGNESVVKRLSLLSHSKKRSHFILLGSTGIGKRALVRIIVDKQLGKMKSDAMLYFSSSADSSIQNVRETVTNFVSKRICLENDEPRMIVFEDAEKISEGVQQLMRAVIERYSCSAIQCIFICHKIDSIIESLQTRCLIISMSKIPAQTLSLYLKKIAAAETVEIDDDAVALLALKADGDVRQAINYLELLSKDKEGRVTKSAVRDVCLFPCYEMIGRIVEMILRKSPVLDIMLLVRQLLDNGFSGLDILGFVQHYICLHDDSTTMNKQDTFRLMSTTQLKVFINELAVTTLRIKEGVNSYLQVFAMIARLMKS